ncbi:MAG: zf-HC2 domain-containing protein [Polyangiaceae bacterium]
MNVVGLHPEELIDKLAAGELSGVERERLDAHLAQCSACRFEIGVRADLEQEIPVFEDRPQLTFPNPSERARPAAAAPRMAASIRPRSRRRWPLVMLAAALVLCAGGATAAVLTGAVQARWLPWVPEP